MTIKDIVDLIAKQGYRAEVEEDSGTGIVRVTSSETLPAYVREAIEASVPAAVKVSFVTKSQTKMPLPKALQKWYNMTKRYMS